MAQPHPVAYVEGFDGASTTHWPWRSLVALATQRPARVDVAMTGEITLRGQVLPVGGIREKVLAAHRAGIRDVILPDRNRKDEPEIPEAARQDLRLHYVKHIREVLGQVLLPGPEGETSGDDDAAAAEEAAAAE